MRKTASYVLGALDALVKAGELSPDYAAGVASVLEKQGGFLWDTTADNYSSAYRQFAAANPGRVRADGSLDIRPDEATALVDKSRNWWEGDGVSLGDWAKNRWGKLTRWWPGTKMTGAMYDRQYQDMVNRARQNRIQQMSRNGIALHPSIAGGVQDAHMRDAGFRLEDAKATMSDAEREQAGLTDDYADTYRFHAGETAAGGGGYKPQHFTPKNQLPKQPAYGEGLPRSYGANKDLFYTQGYVNPLDQS